MMFAVGASFSTPQDRGLVAHHVAGTVERRHRTDANALPSEEADDIGQLVHCRPASMVPVSGVHAELPCGAFETTPLLNAKAASYTSSGARSAIRDEMKVLLKYSLPVFGIHMFEHSIMMATVISIGHISTVALAAATLGFMTANVTGLSILQGMANTLDTVLPPAWTSDQPKLVGLWTQRMIILVCVVLIPMLALWLHAEPLLLGLNQDPEIAKLAGIYLKWASLGLPAYAFNCVSRRYFQSQGLFTVPTRIILYLAPINIFLNYLLVWGPEPFCLGFIGAPIAASISYNFVAIAFVVYGAFFVPRTAWHPITLRAFTNLGYLAKLSVGGIGQLASSWWSWEFVGLIASFLGPVPLATQSVLITTCSSFFQAPYAVGIATSVRIGNLLGERNAERARTVVTASFLLIIVLATLFSSVLITFRRSWGHLFNDDPEVLNLVAAVLPLVALVQIFDDTGAVVAGILRARGKQVLGATLNIREAVPSPDAYYVIGLPIGLWLTFKRDFGLFGLWWGLNIAMAYGSSIGLYLCLTTDWDKEVEKVVERLAVDKGYKLADEERVH
ncbi:MATE efflux family protein [Pisolithus thermaeus]|nr:MATE efflux family protein [Pisolithus croceorrhizus]KAI6160775.1 MATE efflux family protein [Pisolithus thermaeus]